MRTTGLSRRLKRLEMNNRDSCQYKPVRLPDDILKLIYGLYPDEQIPRLIKEYHEDFDRQNVPKTSTELHRTQGD